MPEVPKLMAAAMTRLFATPVTITRAEDVAPRLRRIRFAHPSLVGRAFAAHDHIEFRVDDRCFRHYSIEGFDSEEGAIDALFFLHGQGPGSHWARALKDGAVASMLGPGAGRFRVDPAAPRHVFLGDETAIGLAAWMRRCLDGVTGALEVEEDCAAAAAATGLQALPRTMRGDTLVAWLEEHPAQTTDGVYLTGHAQTIHRLQQALRSQGIPRDRVRVDPFWADGKRGL